MKSQEEIFGEVGEPINGVLSDAMEKAIEGRETGCQIREALTQ